MSDDQQPCGCMQIQISRDTVPGRKGMGTASVVRRLAKSSGPVRKVLQQVQVLVERSGELKRVMSKLSQ